MDIIEKGGSNINGQDKDNNGITVVPESANKSKLERLKRIMKKVSEKPETIENNQPNKKEEYQDHECNNQIYKIAIPESKLCPLLQHSSLKH